MISKIKLKDIANHLSLSVPTVSRALGGFEDISKATRELVEHTAKQMGYRPNTHAQNLVSQKISLENILLLGVPNVLKSISLNSYYAEITRAFCDIMDTNRYRLILSAEDDNENEFVDYHKLVRNHAAVAYVILDIKEDDERVKVLNEADVPFVVMGEYEPKTNKQYAVWTDNIKGAFIATSHLIRIGRKKIAMVGGLHGQLVSKSRTEGYKKALQQFNIEYNPGLIIEPDELDEQGGYLAMLELIHRKIEFDAVFCASDLRSIGVIKALHENNLEVPKDVAVVGYDDLTIASFFNPPLTTIKQPTYKVGIFAMKILEKLIHGESFPDKKKIFIPELIIRTSA